MLQGGNISFTGTRGLATVVVLALRERAGTTCRSFASCRCDAWPALVPQPPGSADGRGLLGKVRTVSSWHLSPTLRETQVTVTRDVL